MCRVIFLFCRGEFIPHLLHLYHCCYCCFGCALVCTWCCKKHNLPSKYCAWSQCEQHSKKKYTWFLNTCNHGFFSRYTVSYTPTCNENTIFGPCQDVHKVFFMYNTHKEWNKQHHGCVFRLLSRNPTLIAPKKRTLTAWVCLEKGLTANDLRLWGLTL